MLLCIYCYFGVKGFVNYFWIVVFWKKWILSLSWKWVYKVKELSNMKGENNKRLILHVRLCFWDIIWNLDSCVQLLCKVQLGIRHKEFEFVAPSWSWTMDMWWGLYPKIFQIISQFGQMGRINCVVFEISAHFL